MPRHAPGAVAAELVQLAELGKGAPLGIAVQLVEHEHLARLRVGVGFALLAHKGHGTHTSLTTHRAAWQADPTKESGVLQALHRTLGGRGSRTEFGP